MRRLAALVTVASMLGATTFAATDSALEVMVPRSPTPGWIKVYHDGQLSSEWQEAGGPAFWALDALLRDDLPTRLGNTPPEPPMLHASL